MGGGVYGSLILGWTTIAYVERNNYCQKVIKQRIKDGWFHNAKIYGDIKKFNDEHAWKYKGQADILTGGFPCQPHSVAGKREGTSDDRYLWDEIKRTIQIIRPARLFFENVQGLLSSSAIIDICNIIESLGYQLSKPLLLGSDDCGNIHRRKRVWIYATDPAQQPSNACGFKPTEYQKQQESQFRNSYEPFDDTNNHSKRASRIKQQALQGRRTLQRFESIRSVEELFSRSDVPSPIFCGMDDELPGWRKQLEAVGNGQDPIVMATAYQLLSQPIT